jgi:putative SOS response-associated peptidase YedK
MCGRYTMHHSPQQVEMRFGVTEARTTTSERYNIAPTQSVPVIVEADGARFLDAMQWGLVPSWAKDPGIGNKMINARAETLPEKPSFKVALSRRRCIIPADGWKQPDGTPLRTCTIITTTPNDLMELIHNRMPAILLPEEEATWLDAARKTPQDVIGLLHPYPAELMEAYPVDRRVNVPTLEDPALLNSL